MKDQIRKYIKKALEKRGYELVKKSGTTSRQQDSPAPVIDARQFPDRKAAEPVRYIHIGYPKCASTSLQLDFFGKHPQLYHLGSGCHDFSIGYIDGPITTAIEREIRFARNFSYDKKLVHEAFNHHFSLAKANSKAMAVGVSCEHFSFNYLNDIDTETKAQRLCSVFGKDTKIIMVIRSQKDMLEALYKEHIRQGYPGTYVDFLTYTFNHRYKSWLTDFRFDMVYQLYAGLFGEGNILVIPFELIKTEPEKFLSAISGHLGVEHYISQIKDNNVRLNPVAIEIKRQLNARCTHGVNQSIFNPSHLNRFYDAFQNEADQEVLKKAIMDHELKEALTALAARLSSKAKYDEINLDLPSVFEKQLRHEFDSCNRFIQEKTVFNLSKYNY